ncbi:phage terminase large subunit [Brevibacillus reuszeri]|uniref:phage terminase large subunit n=1 Tax=Brevibacillus reuszeri TaxID=54915 RepID=UPI003673069D
MQLTDEQRQEIAKQAKQELARRNYYDYVAYTHGHIFSRTRHGEYICNKINTMIERKERMRAGLEPKRRQYMVLSVPPRHGKSMHLTETLPSYFLGKFPDERVIVASYGSDFAVRFGKKNREKINLYGNGLFGIGISGASSSATDWDIEGRRGGMNSRGMQAGLTGLGADLMIIDDPIKNREEANSDAYRNKLWEEWVDSASSRLNGPDAIVIIIMTRWHEDDLVGRLLNEEYGKVLEWDVVNLPLECDEKHINDEGNPLNREIGEPLWPENFGKDFIDERKGHPQSFNSLYQGRPTAQEGNMLKRDWWKYYDVLPEIADMIISVDASFKDTKDSAKCSIQVWGKTGPNNYMIDNVTARMNFVTALQTIRNVCAKYPQAGAKYVEDKANGSAIINVLNLEIGGFIPVKADSGTGGKEARVQAVSPWIQSGNTFLPRGAAWVHDFVEECASFPQGAFADQVDAMSQALNQLIYQRGQLAKGEQLPATPEERLWQHVKKSSKKKGVRME